MRKPSHIELEDAIKTDDVPADKSAAEWFPSACKVLFDGKAGTALHYASGFDERTCQRYAAGHVKGNWDFLRALLRSHQGGIWLEVVMDGSEAPWWADLRGARDLCSRYRIERRT